MPPQDQPTQNTFMPAPVTIDTGAPVGVSGEMSTNPAMPTVSGNGGNVGETVIAPQPARKFPVGILIVLVVVALGVGLFFVLRNLIGGGTSSSKQVTLTYWGLWEDNSIIEPLIAEYQQKNPNVKINYVGQSKEDYRERLTNAIAKGSAPDIFRFHNTWVPMFKNDLDYLPSSVMSAADFAKTFYPIASSDLTSGTGIVGVPLEYDGIALFVNDDILSKAGKTAPKTWDELRQTAKDLTTKDENGLITQAGVALGRTENVDHWQDILALMMLQNGVDLNNPTGQLAEDALTFYTVFSSVDGVWDTSMPTSTVAFAAGKVAMYFGPSWEVFEIKAQNPDLKFRVVPVPQLAKSSPSEPDISYASYWVEGVSSKSNNKVAAWDFLKFLSTQTSMEKLYQNASSARLFGEPYSRTDMANLLTSDPIASVFITQAPNAQSWYLASRTWDGPTGINTQISKYFEDAVNAVNSGTTASQALVPVASGVTQVLQQYGLVSK